MELLHLSARTGSFSLPKKAFLLALPSSTFLVYAYCEDRRHPGYRIIAGAMGLSLNTVAKSVDILMDKGLITVEQS